ncbi:MBL fold metallo-hydrolase [Pseudalkalibacillus sp. R45]|uniref:MBL fold metallo-hydrolase n=1 Tax=Pseudalkalibacillus sp. R45 TaxID=3457433 RepID=UPI003FCE3320
MKTQVNFLKELKSSLLTLNLVLPDHTFKKENNFSGSRRHAKLFTYGGGHSYCDAVLYLPKEKVVFMGDLLFVDTHPTFFEESKPNSWMSILNEINKLDIEVAVPGHGAIGTKRELGKVTEYIQQLLNIAENTLDIERMTIPPAYQKWTSSGIFHKNLKLIKGRDHPVIN